jgi:hypothetical protein
VSARLGRDSNHGIHSEDRSSICPEKRASKQGTVEASVYIIYLTEGRLEKRLRLSIPLELSKVQGPNGAVRTITESACTVGAGFLVSQARELNERSIVRCMTLTFERGPASFAVSGCPTSMLAWDSSSKECQGPSGRWSFSTWRTSLPDREDAGYDSARAFPFLAHCEPMTGPE